MKTTAFAAVFASAALVGGAACHSSSSSPADASADGETDGTTSGGESGVTADGGEGGTTPPVPTFGMQIDRMGRPAITTALIATFNPNTAQQGVAKDQYNFDSNPAHWSTWVPTLEQSLPIYDGLDNVCGNQLAFGALGNPGYATLAAVLAADTLWLNTGTTTCSTYLGVELNALGVANTDCGGRTLTYNVIDVTYNALAGTLSTTSPPGPVTNGVTMPSSPPSTTFPFLASPH